MDQGKVSAGIKINFPDGRKEIRSWHFVILIFSALVLKHRIPGLLFHSDARVIREGVWIWDTGSVELTQNMTYALYMILLFFYTRIDDYG